MLDYILKAINYFLKFADIKLDKIDSNSNNDVERKCCKCKGAMQMIQDKYSDIISELIKDLSIPIDLNVILQKENISLFPMDLSKVIADAGITDAEILGFIKKDENGTVIVIDDKDTFPRQRFTIAHELGHHFLHMKGQESCKIIELRGLNKNDPKEIDADNFAVQLLIPKDILLEEYNKLVMPTSLGLASTFNVSNAAMRYRLDLLGLSYYD